MPVCSWRYVELPTVVSGVDGFLQNRQVADGHQQEMQVAEAPLQQIRETYRNACCLRCISKSQNEVCLFDLVFHVAYCFGSELNVL